MSSTRLILKPLRQCRTSPPFPSALARTYQFRAMATGQPSTTAQAQDKADSAAEATFSSHGITQRQLNEAAGVKLTEQQKVLVNSVLDLFEGKPTLKHLSLWSKTATFNDPLTHAVGYDKYAAQWYGLPAVFSPIKLQSCTVTSSGDPITLDVVNSYTVKGLGKEQTISSEVDISVGADGRIERVQDKWNGKLPEGVFADAFRKLNAVSVPAMVRVPKTEEEDLKMKAEREKAAVAK